MLKRLVFIGEIVELPDEYVDKYTQIIGVEVFLRPFSRERERRARTWF